MKKLSVFLLALSVSIVLHSQNENPFKKFSYDVLTATSSKGEFREFHDQTDIVEIGSILYNTQTGEIVKVLDRGEPTVDISSATAAMSIDPHCEKYYWISPYAYCLNNPIKFIDPDGRDPIYDREGCFLGTDDKGLKGYAIVMDKDNFKQGMSNKDALSFNTSTIGDVNDKISEHWGNLPNRPDYDGKLTLSEANEWYRNGNGEPLYVDAAQIDLSPVTTKDLTEGKGRVVNFESPGNANSETGLVYGNIHLTLLDANSGAVKLGIEGGLLDNYGFEMHEGVVNIEILQLK